MLKTIMKRKDFDEKYQSWQYVDLKGVEKNKFIVTPEGTVMRIEEIGADTVKIAILESTGRKNGVGAYMTTFSAGIEYPTAKVVATAFVAKNREEQDRIWFIDGDKENIHADNLKWMTHKEIMKAYYDNKKKNDQSYSERSHLTAFIEHLIAQDDAKLDFMPPKPDEDAYWDEDLKDWVWFSSETWVTEDDGSDYELTEEEWKQVDRECRKQWRLGLKYGNSSIKEKKKAAKQLDYDPEGEF